MKKNHTTTSLGGALALAVSLALSLPGTAGASSHMDAPLITLDPAANTTDVYAFVADNAGEKTLITALGVYPHQEPGVGPNKYNFDDKVLYKIHVATGGDVADGKASFTSEFRFSTTYRNSGTILQSYLGVVNNIADGNQNLIQTYTVTKVDNTTGARTDLGNGIVPPNNQGIATPLYNQGDDGENPAKPGVATTIELDPYTAEAISTLSHNYVVFRPEHPVSNPATFAVSVEVAGGRPQPEGPVVLAGNLREG